ncbi:MAG: hypothetical protein CME61_06145 [Halobacteriovoraceae bacterium]|nr:hypothetical protein [Halobacteriovoraceae bacterium]
MKYKKLLPKRNLFTSKIISIFLFLLLSLNTFGGNCLYLALADFSARSDTDRHDEIVEFWKAYKSDPSFVSYVKEEIEKRGLNSDYTDKLFNYPSVSDLLPIKDEVYKIFEDYKKTNKAIIAPEPPKEVNLSLEFLRSEPNVGGEIIPWFRANWSVETRALTTYEADLLSLKRGDTVNIDGKKFRLGNFLGAGNTTHVYEILDANGKATSVIRLPAVADFIVDRPKVKVPLNRWIDPDGIFRDDVGIIDLGSRRVYQNIKKGPRSLEHQGYTGFKFNRQYVEQWNNAKCKPAFSNCYYTVDIKSYDKNYQWIEAEKIDFPTETPDGRTFLENYSANPEPKKLARLQEVLQLAKDSGATDTHHGQFNWGIRPDTGDWDWILVDW